MLLCFIIMFRKYKESFPGNWGPFFWLVPRQCIQVLFKMLFFDEFLLFLRRGGLFWIIIQLVGILQKFSACYKTEHPYWTFQPQSILKVHVTMFKPHNESDSWSHVKFSFICKGKWKEIFWRILQCIRCNSGSFPRYPFNCNCLHHKMKAHNQ